MVAAPAVSRHHPGCGAATNLGTRSPDARAAASERHHCASPPGRGCPVGGPVGGDSAAREIRTTWGHLSCDPPGRRRAGRRRGRHVGEASDEGEPHRPAAGQACPESAGVVARAAAAHDRRPPLLCAPQGLQDPGSRCGTRCPGHHQAAQEALAASCGGTPWNRRLWKPTLASAGLIGQVDPIPRGANGSRHASSASIPCATPTPAFSSKPASRSSPSLAGSARRSWLYSAYIHSLHARRRRARSRRHGCLVQRGSELPGTR